MLWLKVIARLNDEYVYRFKRRNHTFAINDKIFNGEINKMQLMNDLTR